MIGKKPPVWKLSNYRSLTTMEPINKILTKKLKRKVLYEAYILGVAQQIVGQSGRVVSIKNGRLKIACHDNLVGFSLATRREKLAQQINEQLKEPLVLRIVIEIKH